MKNHPKVFLTGATGFIGQALCKCLSKLGISVVAPIRNHKKVFSENIETPIIDGFNGFSKQLSRQTGISTVIHVAALAHVTGLELEHFLKMNTETTLELAKTAASVGVKRFIFISSIGVNGVSNKIPFTIQEEPKPSEPYAVSKWHAEIGLKQIAKETGMEVVIIRPPLVYGPNAPGNFGRLLKLAQKNWPLPFGAIDNKRDLVGIDNLVDLIVRCITHPKAANKTFLVSDDRNMSTTELLKLMILTSGKNPKLIPIPVIFLKFIAMLFGKKSVIERLCGNLQVDISHTKETLRWKPPISVEEGIRRCFKN